jgi:hypothetical protein
LAHLWLDDVALGTKMNKNFHHHQSLRKPKKIKILSSSLSHTHRATTILTTSSFMNNKKVSDVSIKKVTIFMTNNEQKKEHQFFGNPFLKTTLFFIR